MAIRRPTTKFTLLFLPFLLLLTGCTKTFDIRPVAVPRNVYEASLETSDTAARSIKVTDARGEANKPLNTGTLNVRLRGMDDEMRYLEEQLNRVLNAEGIETAAAGEGDVALKVVSYRIRNLRTSGFSPYHTFTTFSADLDDHGQTRRISAYFKNSKVPVWAFREVERPCYQIPTEVIVKEIAAKLNRHVFHRSASTETVEKLLASIGPGSADAASEQYLKVLELGYTNNPAAIEPLVRLTEHSETVMREAAISALGTLGAEDQFPLLKKIYQTKEKIDKTMALKSIGDLDTPEAREFIRQVKLSEDYEDEEEIREVADLYTW